MVAKVQHVVRVVVQWDATMLDGKDNKDWTVKRSVQPSGKVFSDTCANSAMLENGLRSFTVESN